MEINRHVFILTLLAIVLISLTGCHRVYPNRIISSTEVLLVTHHDRYMTALGEADDWSLGQELEPTECGRFTLHKLDNDKVALETCKGRFVTAQRRGGAGMENWEHWELWQDSAFGDCGQFTRHDVVDGTVAFETCAGRYVTAGDGGWPAGLQWSVIAQTDEVQSWEKFTLQPKP